MASIQATLGLDDSNYTNALKRAEASSKSFGASAAASFKGADDALAKTAKGVEAVNSKFQMLTQLMVGAGIAEFARSLLDSANQMKDMADALDVSISRMMELGVAASTAGGDLDKVDKMMGKLEMTMGQAIEGTASARVALLELGVSIESLSGMTLDEKFNKVVRALAEIENPAVRASKASEIFGKTFRGINFGQLAEGLDKTTGTMDAYGASQLKAAEIAENLSVKFTLLKASFLQLLEPILNLYPATEDMNKQLESAGNYAKVLMLGLGAYAFSTVANAVQSLGSSLKSLAGFFALDTGVIATNTVAMELNREEYKFRASAIGTLGTATSAVIRAELALTAAQQTGMATKAEIAVLENAIAAARTKQALQTAVLAGTTQAYAGVQAEVAATGLAAGVGTTAAATGIAATGTAATIATGPLYAVGLALGRLTAFLLTTVAPVVAFVGALELVNLAGEKLSKTFGGGDGVGPLDGFAIMLESFIKDKFPALHSAIEKTGDMLGMGKSELRKIDESGVKAVDKNSPEAKQRDLEIKAAQEAADAKKKMKDEEDARIAEGTRKMIAGYQQQADAIRATTAQNQKLNDLAAARIKLQTDSIGLSKAEQAAELARFDAKSKYEAESYKINQEIAAQQAKIAADPKGESTKGAYLVIDALKAQKAALKDVSDQTYELTLAEGKRKDALEMSTYFIEAQKKATETMRDLDNEIADLTMTENEKKVAGVQRLIDKEIELAIAKRQTQLGTNADGSAKQVSQQEVDQITQKVNQSYAGLKDKTQTLIGKSREFATGWQKAMKQYVEDTGDAAKKAQTLFTTAFKGMEDAIVGFAKTGKFEWKGFVSDMLEQLLRSQVQGVFANMMGSISNTLSGSGQSGGGQDSSIMGMIGSLFGGGGGSTAGGSSASSIFGGGGSSQGTAVYVTNWPGGAAGGIASMLGGGGAAVSDTGGLWDTISSWFGGGTASGTGAGSAMAGSLWGAPADTGNSGSTGDFFSGIADSLGSVATGISDFFSGFFADGGSIPAGKFGVVGEAGREFVKGPATVIPEGKVGGAGNGVQVTNIFNTIDLKSFQQWVAQDPTFMAAVVSQGLKGSPM